MHFRDATGLDDVVKYIQDATRGPDGKHLWIFIDPVLTHGDRDPTTVRSMDLEGVPLRRSLQLGLEQTGLSY